MFFNSFSFYNYSQLENCSLIQSEISFSDFNFNVKFNFSTKEKKKIMQTSDLLYQIFLARPKISVVKKLDKISSFNIFINPNFNSLIRIFRLIYLIRNSSRKKLINFNFKRSGSIYITLRDFVTLFPFKIRVYDFHDWRLTFVLASSMKNFTVTNTEFNKFNSINFYFNFFNLT